MAISLDVYCQANFSFQELVPGPQSFAPVEFYNPRSTSCQVWKNQQFLEINGELKMTYVDGFVAAVPSDKKEAYIKCALTAAEVFKEHGALKVVECWGNDVPEGKLTSFTMAVKREEHEVVVFSWITWPSKEVREEAWKLVMADPRLSREANPMPFDCNRMIYGGFDMIVEV